MELPGAGVRACGFGTLKEVGSSVKRYVFSVLLLVVSLSVVAQTLLPRKYPSLRIGHVIPGGGTYQAPTDQEAINILMSLYGRADADAVRLWESQHADLTSGGHTGVATYNTNYVATEYVYFQSIYTNLNSRDTGLRKAALQRGWDFESFALHFKEDTYIDSNAVGFTNTILYGKPTQLGYVPTYTDACNQSLGSNDAVLGSGSKNGLWVAVPEEVAEITIPISTPGDPGVGGQVVIEYVNAVDENFHITGWGQVTITYDGTNGLRQSGTIKWLPPTDWKWCIPYPPHSLGSALLISENVGCYIFRVRAMNYAVTPRVDINAIKGSILRQVLQLVTTSYRKGSVISATSNSVTINNGRLYKSTDYYKSMTIEIVSGTGTGQSRTVTASTASYTPTLTVSPNWDVVPDTTSVYRITGPTVMVPGWDPANDANGDGYVDDNEFASRPNPNASARFRWEARVTAGSGWSSSNATCRANLWNPQYRQALVEYYTGYFNSRNVKGYDNDDATVLLFYSNTATIHGGRIWEYDGPPVGHSDEMNLSYRDAFLTTHSLMAQNGIQWRGTNISQTNMIISPFTRPYLQHFTFFRCEQTIMDSQGLLSYAGILRNWKIPAYAAAGVRSVVQCQTTYGNFISYLGNTQEAWERLTMNKLAMFYLLNVPDYTFFQSWNRTYDYGSYNTVVGTSIRGYWKAGVPQNMAYFPLKVLEVDIGEPANRISGSYDPIEYILGQTNVPGYGEYFKVGNSTQSVLTVPVEEGGTLQVPIVPTYAYYLWKSPTTTYGVPTDAVVAREYTKGLVLCRMPGASAGDYLNYINSTVRVQLPGGPYRRINYDGTLGPPVTEIDVRGFDGIILLKAAETSNPNIQISLSVDKTNPKPLDVVTVTVEVRNTGSGEAPNVEIRLPLANMVYEQGSLSPQGYTVDTSDSSTLKITIPSIAAGSQITLQFRLIQRGS